MASCVIELNDNEIRVGVNGAIVQRSPGYALIDGDRIELGEAAVNQARLQPRAVHNRYWKNLNQDPLKYPTTRARHHADLAFAQLLAIHEQAGKPEQAIFVVPGTFSKEQLALLLGLVDASPFSAVGLVDSAVAALAPVVGAGNYVHIDIHIHETVLTRISVDNEVKRISVNVIDGAGMAAIVDTCAHLIADLFIKEARFDPQHHPETEQALYEQIPACLSSLRSHNEVFLEIEYQQTQHQAKLPATLLFQALAPQFEKIANAIDKDESCLLSQQLGNLPGISDHIHKAEVLADINVVRTCQLHETLFRSTGSALNFVTILPVTDEPDIAEIAKPAPAQEEVVSRARPDISHILHEHNAYALNEEHMYLSASGIMHSSNTNDSHCSIIVAKTGVSLKPEGELTVFLNGQQLKRSTEVNAGDIISFVGSKTEYTFIHVND
jgi:hypothetical protein